MFLLCFSLVDHESFRNTKATWKPALLHNCPELHIILVALKLDLRENEEIVDELRMKNLSPITTEEGIQMAEEIGAVNYLECSSLKQVGINEIFEEAVKTIRTMPVVYKKKRKCALM